MPRTARSLPGDVCFHVMSRGNGGARVFHAQQDYEEFTKLIRLASDRLPMRVYAWCLMPNHFHFAVRPYGNGDLSRWMHWLLTSHVQRHRKRHGTTGRIWQGRFKAPPVQEDHHLLTVMRYIERNPVAAGLVGCAEDWPWSSGKFRCDRPDGITTASPIDLHPDWMERVNVPQSAKELKALRTSIERGRPFGDAVWTRGTAARLGLANSLRPRGRPPISRGAEEVD